MPAIKPVSDEDWAQLKLLGTAPGETDSGRTRYGAAMYFYQRGMISPECLEVYRTCSRIDHEDPQPFLASLGLADEVAALTSTARKEATEAP